MHGRGMKRDWAGVGVSEWIGRDCTGLGVGRGMERDWAGFGLVE